MGVDVVLIVATMLVSVLATAISSIATILFKQKTDKKTIINDELEAKKEVEASKERLLQGSKNIFDLMISNVSELKEYYIISKRQANRVFSSTLLICFLGFFVFVAGIIANIYTNQNILIYTTISGSIIEIIAGLFFWLYKNTLSQLNLYHERLGATEKYLTAMQLAEKMSDEKKDEIYKYMIEVILIDNSYLARKSPDESN